MEDETMMRRNSLLIAGVLAVMLFTLTTAQAHTRSGTWTLQGAAAFSSSNGDLYGDDSRTAFAMSPGVHYFLMDKFALGIEMPLATVKHGDVSRTSMYIGPSAEYYLGDVDATTNPYLGAGIFVRSESLNIDGPGGNVSSNGSDFAFKGGLAVFLREYLAIKPELSLHLESLEEETGTTLQFGVGLAGFLY